MNVTGLQAIHQGLLSRTETSQNATGEEVSFKDILMEALRSTDRLEKESDAITNDFIAGNTDNIPSVLIAAEKASLSLDLVIEVRDKILDAYNEIMRMQV